MRKLMLFILGGCVVVAMLAAVIPPRSSPASADTLLQGVPRLDGYRIYFSDANTAASRFDRSGSGLSRLAGLLQLLGADLYTLEWQKNIPPDADLVVIAGPTRDLTAVQIARLWLYVSDGGNLLLLTDPLVDSTRAFSRKQGFFWLTLTDFGIRAQDDVVGIEGDQQEEPTFIVDFLATTLADHPITEGIEGVYFWRARSIQIEEDIAGITILPLVSTESNFYGETAFRDYQSSGVVDYNSVGDTTRGSLPLAAAVENAATGTRMVLIGDREVATNNGGLQTSPPYSPYFLYPDNARFMLNVIAWLVGADSTNTVDIKFVTPAVTSTPTTVPSPTPATPAPEEDGE